uniref:Uncharacterized protein n=1 Tax=Timema shepardi TaxID=629360 RepID=A0A7R9B3F4_TIMSH|nr:unnamed protein product [Timema shepardi]
MKALRLTVVIQLKAREGISRLDKSKQVPTSSIKFVQLATPSTSSIQFVHLATPSTSSIQFVQLATPCTSSIKFVQLATPSTSSIQFVQLATSSTSSIKFVQLATPSTSRYQISFALGKLLFPGNVAMQLGMFFTGVSPAGGASNIWTFALGGNMGLSITMTTISTFAAFGMMPMWIFTLGRVIFEEGALGVPYTRIASFALGLVVPLGLGFLIQRYLPRVSKFMVRILKPFSLLLILFIVVFAIITNLYLFQLFTWQVYHYHAPLHLAGTSLSRTSPPDGYITSTHLSTWQVYHYHAPLHLAGTSLAHTSSPGRYITRTHLFTLQILVAGLGLPWLGFVFGWLLARVPWFKQSPEDVLAISIETGIQNTGISIFLLRFSLGQPEADLTTVVPVAVAIMTPLPLMLMYVIKVCRERFEKRHKIEFEPEDIEKIAVSANGGEGKSQSLAISNHSGPAGQQS